MTKNLRGALGADFDSLIKNLKAAAFATSEREMRVNWEAVMKASVCV